MALSKESQRRLARSFSAYIRDTPARELPGDLRRWRSWRPQTIASRAGEIVARLDDDGIRSQVLEWLDDKPSLPKTDVQILRLACARPEGWEDKVAALMRPRASKKTARDPAEQLRGRLEKEKTRTADAREELRKAKEQGRKAIEAEKRRLAEMKAEFGTARKEIGELRARVRELEADLSKERERTERELRREKSAVDKAQAEKDRLAAEARSARKEVAELRRGMRSLENKVAAALRSKRSTATGRGRPKQRQVLSAPQGLFEDAPETLSAWLAESGVRLLIDGYNVTKSERGFGDLKLADQRKRLMDGVARLARKHGAKATIVFDGSEIPPGTRRKPRLPIQVEYSKPDEIADDHLIALLEALPPDPVVVVTNDRELQDRARAVRATIATSDQLLALLR